jgi:hypothetical protein
VLYWSWLASWWVSQREQPSPEYGNGQG